MERRNRQSLNLITGTQPGHSTGRQGQERTNDREDICLNRWIRISLRAQQNKTLAFENLLTHINVESLKEAFKAIDGSKAKGVDGMSKVEYGEKLEANLMDLVNRIHNGSYKPMPKREVLIPKANGKTRPIAIACFEDKLVDWTVGKILTQIYEPLFIPNSFGYRPNKAATQAMETCYYSLCKNKRKYVVEIDFSNFFNTIPHGKLMRMIGKRISDKRFKGLIGRFLKGELINAEGENLPSEIGTPQGSIMSPILANIYLNEVIDQWFMKDYASYHNVIVRYADDAVFIFKDESDAKQFLVDLERRTAEFGLSLNKDKTQMLKLAKGGHQQMNFVGFTIYWGKQASRTMLKVKTQKEKLVKSMQEFDHWIKRARNTMKLKEIWELAKSKIRGHNNYYGYWMNGHKLNHFYWEAIRSLYKWLNRRSQKRSYTWEGFCERLKYFPLLSEPFNQMKLKRLGWSPYV
jgi:RNA-directed DNA polymerase